MLSRTANGLFWLARHMERLDYVARLLDVAQRMSVLGGAKSPSEWTSALAASGSGHAFAAKHGAVTPKAVIDWLARDPDNPSSILSCLATARENARAVRGALTSDMWEALNTAFLDARRFKGGDFEESGLTTTLDWFKMQSLLFNGAYSNTMLRQGPFFFVRLGTFVERADNTARLLDVKYHVLLPSVEEVGGGVDYYQWIAILRAVSARRAYHFVYAERIRPWHVAELLILRQEMPRSLRSCYEQIVAQLDALAEGQGGRVGECHRQAGETHARLRYGRIEAIFQDGLHEFLTESIVRTRALGLEIEDFYFA
ncbi:MAG: alpha-E domain-containing protein [Geminicoccaceae bacterium]|nr:alpha-E domain-containing protein [Geminicoccaceae bacterium]